MPSLRGADLSNADLGGAYLDDANLAGADLRGATLSYSDLNRAVLAEADLRGADLIGVGLDDADLSRVICGWTVFANVDLSKVKGLDSVEPAGPCTVGTDTLLRSQGKIPEPFLRGCGVPPALIAYLPNVFRASKPIQFYSCFICYSHQDEEFAKLLYSRMVDGKLSVWYAPEHMEGGRKIIDQLNAAIQAHDKLLLILSEASMCSDWGETELRTALRREKTENRHLLFPIRITSEAAVKAWKRFDADTGRDLAIDVRAYHILDFSDWKNQVAFKAAFAKLLSSLKTDESTGATAGPTDPPKTAQ
jgi:hypothetical protein